MVIPEQKSGGIGIAGGINRKVNPFIKDEGLYTCQGFHLNEVGSLTKWQGFSKYNSVQLAGETFTGMFDFVTSDGTRYVIATGLSGVYRYGTPTANTWNVLTLPSGYTWSITANNHVDFVVLKDILYIFNGTQYNLKFDPAKSTTQLYKMGIDAPASAPTAASGGAGVLTGGYSYKVTFYDSVSGHESNPSAVSNTFTTSSNQISLTSIPVSTDAQVNKRRIYRTTTGGGVWLWIADINDNTTTSWTDNNPDSSLGIEVESFAHGVPPIAAMAVVYKGHVFMVAKASSRIWFSKQNFPNAVNSNDFRDLDPSDNDNITGIARLFDQIVTYKNDSIWNGFGSDRFSFEFIRQVTGIGGVNHKSIVNVPGRSLLFSMAEDGFHSYNGANEDYVSEAIEPIVKALNQARLRYAYGFVYKPKNVCGWLVSDGVSGQHDLIIFYDYLRDRWITRSILNTKANIAMLTEDSSNNEYFNIGGYGGYVWTGDSGLSDDSAAISCEVIDRARPEEESETIKSFYCLIVYFQPQASVTATASYAVNNPDGTYITIGTIDPSKASGSQRLKFNAQGQRIYIKISHSAIGQPLMLRGWQLMYKDTGRIVSVEASQSIPIKKDTFTESINTPLENHVSDSGGGWSGGDTTNFDIDAASDEVIHDGGLGQYAIGTESPSSADYYVQIYGKVGSNTSGDRIGCVSRYVDNNNLYVFELIGTGGGIWRIVKYVGGVQSVFLNGSFAVNPTTYYTLKFSLRGTSLSGYIDGNLVGSVTDNSLSNAGKIGINMSNTLSRITQVVVDYNTG